MRTRDLVGVRFHPTDDELVNHYLSRKVRKIMDENERGPIPEVNIYVHEPHELNTVYNEKSDEKSDGNESYFFCPRNDSKTNYIKRKTRDGFWKETSEKQIVTDEDTEKVMWIKRYFVYHEGSQKKSCRTDWTMHEYEMEPRNEDDTSDKTDFTLCHIKLKKKKNRVVKQRRRASGRTTGTLASEQSNCPSDLVVPNSSVKSEHQDQEASAAAQVPMAPSVSDANTSRVDQENESKGGADNYDDAFEDGLSLTDLINPPELDGEWIRDTLYT